MIKQGRKKQKLQKVAECHSKLDHNEHNSDTLDLNLELIELHDKFYGHFLTQQHLHICFEWIFISYHAIFVLGIHYQAYGFF